MIGMACRSDHGVGTTVGTSAVPLPAATHATPMHCSTRAMKNALTLAGSVISPNHAYDSPLVSITGPMEPRVYPVEYPRLLRATKLRAKAIDQMTPLMKAGRMPL
mmetsp:Transcript_26819/g.50091  ORF Transcript_26819/g.50091 Transcript_26819/m.50091 type:complete len:105 (+) Transcript_26819:81-395(+)